MDFSEVTEDDAIVGLNICADCFCDEPPTGWAEEAPSFRLCWECVQERITNERA